MQVPQTLAEKAPANKTRNQHPQKPLQHGRAFFVATFVAILKPMPTRSNTSKFVFRLLALYVLFQFVWWAYHIVELHGVIRDMELQLNPEELHGGIQASYQKKVSMVIGEGLVFAGLLLFGLWRIGIYLNKEARLARQERNFMLAVTHELKTPVATLRLFLDTLRKRKLSEDQTAGILKDALNETHRLDHLVENVLLSTRFEQGDDSTHEELDFSALVGTVANKLRLSIGGQHRFEMQLDEGIRLKGDGHLLESLLTNLVDNAVKYAPEGSVIAISLHKKEGLAVLNLSDEGPGIPAEERQQVMQKFYRIGNEETRRSKGTGLGLYLVAQIVKQHKGNIHIEDHHPQGAHFQVSLPAISERNV